MVHHVALHKREVKTMYYYRKCGECGANNGDQDATCRKCGAALPLKLYASDEEIQLEKPIAPSGSSNAVLQSAQITGAQNNSGENRIAKILKVMAWCVFVLGFILGIVFGQVPDRWGDTQFSFALALTYWAVSFFSGMLLLGFAEIIRLLEDVKANTAKKD